MKIVSKQILGYFLVSFFIGSLSILGAYLINRNITEIVSSGTPRLVAALEIEINLNEVLDAVQSYDQTMGSRALTRFDKSIAEYEIFREIYREKITGEEEELILKELDEKAQEMIKVGRELLGIRDVIEKTHDISWESVEIINRIHDDKIQPNIKKGDPYGFEKITLAIGMEVNTYELYFAMESYLVKPSRERMAKVEDSVQDYQNYKAEYLKLPLSPEERKQIGLLDAAYDRSMENLRRLIRLRETQISAWEKAKGLYQEIDDLLDYKIQVGTRDRIGAAEQRALHNISLLIVSILLITIVAIVSGYIMSLKISKPLIGLRDASQRIGLGNLDAKVEIVSDDEIGELGRTFNMMVDNIKETTVSRDFLNKIIHNIEDIILVADSSGIITISNPAASNILGYTHDSLAAKNIGELMTIEREPVDVDRLENMIIGRSIGYHDISFRTASGADIPVNCSASIIRKDSEEKELLVIVARDMRAIKHLMEEKTRLEYEGRRAKELERLNALLTENEKVLKEEKKKAEAGSRAKSAFLAAMSHELRTPMNSIIGYTKLVLQNGKDILPENMYRNLERVDISSAHLLKVINSILDLSKIEAGELVLEAAPFSLSTVVEDSLKTIKGALKNKPLQITYNLSRNVPDHLIGDSGRLMQVMLNLIDNAVKFTAEGTVALNVSLESMKSDSADIRFEIKDTGIGIPKDKITAIFEPFIQADMSTTRKYGGTGLGLSICRSIVEAMKGKIWAESTEGVGSSFISVIPFPIADKKNNKNKEEQNV